MTLREEIARTIQGDVYDDADTLATYSRDTSIFERTPKVVVFPKNTDDVAGVVRLISEKKRGGENVSIAPRSAGTDMTGGPLTHSVSLVFSKYINKVIGVGKGFVDVEPGAYYRDIERETLKRTGELIPSYPASREICAIGGMINNNSGGELTLQYGKTNRYIEEIDVVLSDGSRATLRPLSGTELAQKKSKENLEGAIYRSVHALIQAHESEIIAAKPSVTKNSAGYALWNVWDQESDIFDLTQLIAGAQGTLALVTRAKLATVKLPAHRAMLVIFLSDIEILPEIVRRTLKHSPESFESYDDQTFKLAVRFIPQILRHFGFLQALKLLIAFLPEAWLVLRGGVPKLVLMAEFAAESAEDALEQAKHARGDLHGLALTTKIARSETQSAKYWTIRRESFALLRKNLKGLYAAPFIDDIVVHPDNYPQFIPELNALLQEHHLLYTIAGHIGDANFHIIPLMDLSKESERKEIMDLTPKVYALAAKYGGSITGEHNDGIIRTPYLHIMYSAKMIELFGRVKQIFDPLNIFNPGKKVGGTIEDIERDMIKN